MCPASVIGQSQGNTNDDDMISEDDEYIDEEQALKAHGLIGRLPISGRLRLKEVGEEVVSLGKMSFPIVMTSLLLYSRSIVSMLFLSRLGKLELAGGSLAMGFLNITGLSVLKGLAVGMDPLCGQAFGAKRYTILSQTYQRSLLLLLLVSIPISFLWLNVEPIFLKLGQDPEITRFAKVFMVFCIPELIAQAVLHPMRSFLRTQGITAPLTISAIIAVILHTPVNYFLVVYLKLGAKGVALSLAFNTINMNVGLLIYVVASKNSLKPWNGLTALSVFQGWWPLISLGVPSLISVCLEWWWYEIMLFLCGLLPNPKASVTATGIMIQTTGLIYVFPFSLSSGLTTRVSQALGAGQPHRAQWTSIIGIVMAVVYALSACTFIACVRSVWGRMYTNEPQVLHLLSASLPILGLCELGNCPQTAACGVLTGTARPKDGARINLCSFYLVGLPVSLLMAFWFQVGFQGLWFGLLAAQFTCLFMLLYTLTRTDWKHQAKRADELTSAVNDGNDLESRLLEPNQ
ncbi:hypothetical protein K2173_000140 [Erythroxylum novogranatense]|uniref:Protein DETOXIFICATION n=1 Tax=Erythroxylum novogranatense TaxID=1862640 RepID=A0AAV8SPF2_9ROSI|nr:hypothetical protein K2173_000140 [Erythroxylum novogranatense]